MYADSEPLTPMTSFMPLTSSSESIHPIHLSGVERLDILFKESYSLLPQTIW